MVEVKLQALYGTDSEMRKGVKDGVLYLSGSRRPGVWPPLSLHRPVTIIEAQHLAPYLVRNQCFQFSE